MTQTAFSDNAAPVGAVGQMSKPDGYILMVRYGTRFYSSGRVLFTLEEAQRARAEKYGDRLKWTIAKVSFVDENA